MSLVWHDRRLNEEGIAAARAEVEEVVDPKLVEGERIVSHLNEIILPLVRKVRQLDGRLNFSFASNLLGCTRAQQVYASYLVSPQDNLLHHVDGELPQILHQSGHVAHELLRWYNRSTWNRHCVGF